MTLEQHIIAYAKSYEPQEICGFVVFEGAQQRFIACDNIAAEPERYFEIHPDDWLKAQLADGIVALVHSHPDGLPFLSEADRQMQVRSGLDWWLVCDEKIHQFRHVPHLIGREFAHGTADCYSLFRDAYMLAGFDFPEFTYDEEWYREEQDLYLDNMAKHGFTCVSEPQPGDVILMQISSPVANHAAIYLGNQQMLHHTPNRLSKRDIYGGYWQRSTHSIWRHSQWQPSNFTAIYNDLAASSN
ncbi:C40 family peptidase [Testudinibacter sp. P80/BLE/0925]|uniref:C40 family peptidase n=1 Tax=Testudinibacter sp. TW-1 TaxID=3417757 RepID=UPI003D35EBCA